jgi:hypothetical protein
MVSDWKERSIKRRDVRRTKEPEIRPPGGSNKKNTKRWCKGKVGREHKPECRNYSDHLSAFGGSWRILACAGCGKHLDYYYPLSWCKQAKPDWVTE